MLDAQTIREKIQTNQLWLERAILAIYREQTNQEQQSQQTIHDNGVGFNSADANKMSYCARWLLKGNHLTGKYLLDARRIMPKYSKQLLKISQVGTRQEATAA